MSNAIFPTLSGISFPVTRTPIFKSQILESVSGKEVRLALRSAPRYQYEVSYEVLRANQATNEFAALMAFYLTRQGAFDTFQYLDPDDHTVTGQVLGVGDSVNRTFSLFRPFGALGQPKWVDAILAPQIVSAVYFNGTLQSSSNYTVTFWGSTTPGEIIFNSAPSNGVIVSADFSWYWPCRFIDDQIDFAKFMQGFYSVNSMKFITVL